MLEASIKKKFPQRNPPENKFKTPATVKSQTNKKNPTKSVMYRKVLLGREKVRFFWSLT